jgi:hypothetical protein
MQNHARFLEVLAIVEDSSVPQSQNELKALAICMPVCKQLEGVMLISKLLHTEFINVAFTA